MHWSLFVTLRAIVLVPRTCMCCGKPSHDSMKGQKVTTQRLDYEVNEHSQTLPDSMALYMATGCKAHSQFTPYLAIDKSIDILHHLQNTPAIL